MDPSKPAYDVLLDDYSAGLTKERVSEIFTAVKAELVPLLAELRAASGAAAPDASWLSGTYDLDAQAALCRELAVALGFDLEKGRLDVSVHPFTGGGFSRAPRSARRSRTRPGNQPTDRPTDRPAGRPLIHDRPRNETRRRAPDGRPDDDKI